MSQHASNFTFLPPALEDLAEVFHDPNSALKTNLRRMIRIYDFLKYGQ
jgi:hypothetical protein